MFISFAHLHIEVLFFFTIRIIYTFKWSILLFLIMYCLHLDPFRSLEFICFFVNLSLLITDMSQLLSGFNNSSSNNNIIWILFKLEKKILIVLSVLKVVTKFHNSYWMPAIEHLYSIFSTTQALSWMSKNFKIKNLFSCYLSWGCYLSGGSLARKCFPSQRVLPPSCICKYPSETGYFIRQVQCSVNKLIRSRNLIAGDIVYFSLGCENPSQEWALSVHRLCFR